MSSSSLKSLSLKMASLGEEVTETPLNSPGAVAETPVDKDLGKEEFQLHSSAVEAEPSIESVSHYEIVPPNCPEVLARATKEDQVEGMNMQSIHANVDRHITVLERRKNPNPADVTDSIDPANFPPEGPLATHYGAIECYGGDHVECKPWARNMFVWNNKETLFIALAKLIIDKNEEARAHGGEPTIIGKNLDLADKDVPLLFHYWNIVTGSSEITEADIPRHPREMPLPCGFRTASPEEQVRLSLKTFENMKHENKPEYWVWTRHDFTQLAKPALGFAFNYMVSEDMDDIDFWKCNVTWRYCDRNCRKMSESRLSAFESQQALWYHGSERRGRDEKQGRSGKMARSRYDLERTGPVLADLSPLEREQESEIMRRRDENIDFEKKVCRFILKYYSHKEVIFFLLIVDSALHNSINASLNAVKNKSSTDKTILPSHAPEEYNTDFRSWYKDRHVFDITLPNFGQNWGLTDEQWEMACKEIELDELNVRSFRLARAGFGPVLAPNRVYWLLNDWAADPSIPDSRLPANYRQSSNEQRRLLSNICLSHAIRLFVDETIDQNDAELTDSGWNYELGHSLLKALDRFQGGLRLCGRPVPEILLPPGFSRHTSTEEKVKNVHGYIVNVLQPIADWIRTRSWEMEESDDAYSAELWAYSKLMSSLRRGELFNKLPREFLEGKVADQRRLALELINAENARRDTLVAAAIEMLVKEHNGYGPREFRAFESLAIKAAATNAFDTRGKELLPYESTLSCTCWDDDSHRREEIKAIARLMCKKIAKIEADDDNDSDSDLEWW